MLESPEQLADLIRDHAAGAWVGKDDPPLVQLSRLIKRGELSDTEVARCRAAVTAYCDSLTKVPRPERQAFLTFLVQSEIASESMEIRNRLFMLLTGQSPVKASSQLGTEIMSTLLRSRKPPSSALAQHFGPQIRAAHSTVPDWRFVGTLVSLATQAPTFVYEIDDLLTDLQKLRPQSDFDLALRTRNAIWTTSKFAVDAIALLQMLGIREDGKNFPMSSEVSPFLARVNQNAAAPF
jgi:hypothetical protein